jgi:hypothetical protein
MTDKNYTRESWNSKQNKKTKTHTIHNRDRQSTYDLQTTSIDKIGFSCSCKNSVIYDDVVQM